MFLPAESSLHSQSFMFLVAIFIHCQSLNPDLYNCRLIFGCLHHELQVTAIPLSLALLLIPTPLIYGDE